MQVEDPDFGPNYCRDRYVTCDVDTAGNNCKDKYCWDRYSTCHDADRYSTYDEYWSSADINMVGEYWASTRCKDGTLNSEYSTCKDDEYNWTKTTSNVCKKDYPGNYADTYCSTWNSRESCKSENIGYKAAVTV